MKKRIGYWLLLLLTISSCHGKIKQEERVANITPETQQQEREQLRSLIDPMAVDSVKEVLKVTYKKMRETENINWPHGNENSMKMNKVLFLDSLIFKGKEEFFFKVKKHMDFVFERDRLYEERYMEENGEVLGYNRSYFGYDFFDVFHYLFPIVETYLNTKNFVFPTDEVYKQRMNEVFGFNEQIVNDFPLMKENLQLYCFSMNGGQPNFPYEPDEIEDYGNDQLVLPYYFYNLKGYNFIYSSTKTWNSLPDLLVANNEQELKKLYDVSKWKISIKESIYHENNYLFNKSAISLNWLYLHDQEFLTMLYETFGYYGDDRLTQFYIDDVKDTFERFLKYGISPFSQDLQPSLFNNHQRMFGTYRPYDKKFLINKKLLEQFVLLTNGKEDYMYPFILQYTVSSIMGSLDLNDEEIYRELDLFLVSHLCYYSQKIYDKNPDIAALSPGLSHYSALYSQLYLPESRTELLTYLKKHKYFGYSDYPEMIEEMRMEHGMW